MEKLLIKAVSEPKEYGQAKWFEVTDGEGKIYAGTKMEQRTRFVVGQLNEVEIKVVEGKKKPRIELVTGGAVIPEKGKIIPQTERGGLLQPEQVGISPQELGMWYKEIGESWRLGLPIDSKLVDAYNKRMYQVMGLGEYAKPRWEAPQLTGKPPEPSRDSEVLVEEAVELGGEVVPSAEEVKAKVAKLIEANKTLKVGTFVAMMEKLQVGATAKSEKNKFGNATLVGVYQVLDDDNKIKFNKQIGGE